ncbi:ABC transporter C family member 3-like isoform X2 [Wolffia australiana]
MMMRRRDEEGEEDEELEKALVEREGKAVDGGKRGAWSRLTFAWLNPVFEEGRKSKVELRHLPPLPKEEAAEQCLEELNRRQRRSKGQAPVSLALALLLTIWKPLLANVLLAGLNTVAAYVGPQLIAAFVAFLSSPPGTPSTSGYVLAGLLFLAKSAESLSLRHSYLLSRRLGLRLRAALLAALFPPALRRPLPSPLLDSDPDRLADLPFFLPSLCLLPLQLLLALLLLRHHLGSAAAAAALAATLLLLAANLPLAAAHESLLARVSAAKDARLAATHQSLRAISSLKLHAWEPARLRVILLLRARERRSLRRYLYSCAAAAFLFWASPAAVSVVSFAAAAAAGVDLAPGNVLAALATFRILQEPIYNLPELVAAAAQTKIAVNRLHSFLSPSTPPPKKSTPEPSAAVVVEPGEYRWGLRLEKRLAVFKGERVGVCGRVGTGKTSLVAAAMGGAAGGAAAAAYVAQRAWVQTGTVRENIVFGRGMERGRYEEVVRACGLERDVAGWSDGDRTVVGERGVNLSGGQKQRIQLARAVYAGADVFFLDDPFSALDAHTASHLFKECLMGLLAGKTVVYVTHQLEFLRAADRILVMKDGKIAQEGKYDDLAADPNGEFLRQIAAHKTSLSHVAAAHHHDHHHHHHHNHHRHHHGEEEREMEVTEECGGRCGCGSAAAEAAEGGGGRVGLAVYSAFVRAAYKGALVPVIVLCQVAFQGLQIGSNYWIAWAIERKETVTRKKLLVVFVVLSVASSLFVLFRAALLAKVALETAQRLFLDMTNAVFRAPLSFFDCTPSSRILNRASDDQTVVDTDVPYRLAGLVFALVQLLAIIILMSQISWIIFLLFAVVIAISYWYQTYYISTARELGRMVASKKAPILHHFVESASGAATIHCFNQEERFIVKNWSLIDDYSRVSYHNAATMEWLSLRINFLFNLVFFIMLVFLVRLKRSDGVDPGLAGLAATYGLNLNVLQAWVIWNLCNVENKMISVERILQYSKIPSEGVLVNESCRPEPSWPAIGTVDFDDLHVRYGPNLPMVLKGISCKFPGGKKIAVVGRTGSGKSTLIQALFRVVEPCKGRILIDGQDISIIGLHDLRSRLSIIPQDPLLFHGAVRDNLDPLQQHSDHEIWEVVRKCHLGELVKGNPMLLDAPVAEDGENWSLGERQMLCLARALLKKRRILVLDEATASVDSATDSLMQKTIRDETSGCTVITVAHRIPTVIDNDLVLVLDDGRIMEFDTPTALLEDRGSEFSKLAVEYLRRSGTKFQAVVT